VVIEPPGNLRRGRILEVHDGVFVAGELAFVKQRSGTMDQAVVLVSGVFGDAFAMESRKQRGGAGAVKAFVVIEDPNPQNSHSLV